MNIEQAIRAALVADSGVKAITTRCYPGHISKQPAEYPLIVYQKVTGVRDHALRGPTGSANPRFQVEAWAETYGAAKGLANAIRAALDGKSFTYTGCKINSVLIQSERDIYEVTAGCYRIVMDFTIWHTE